VLRLAVFKKGNPEVNRLATSMADYSKEELDRRAFYKGISGLGRRAWFPLVGPKIILPLYDDLERQRLPAMTLGLIVLNVLALSFVFGETDYAEIFAAHGLVPQAIVSGQNPLSLVTYMFLHASVFHLLGNMFFLWQFGDNVEDAFGHMGFACAYLVSGLAAGALHVVVFRNSATPCVGASGAVSGVMGAYLVLYPRASIHTFIFATVVKVPAICYLVCWLAFQLLFGLLHAGGAISGGVAWFTHLGGFLAGIILAALWKAWLRTKHSSD
jgi:membrane associated rhomboid family serine protease